MLNFTPMRFPVNSLLQMPSSGAHRLSSVSSHDSGFVSQDANTHSKPPSPMPSDITSQVAVSAMIFIYFFPFIRRENVLVFFCCSKIRNKADLLSPEIPLAVKHQDRRTRQQHHLLINADLQ